jgi:hypothetical protein
MVIPGGAGEVADLVMTASGLVVGAEQLGNPASGEIVPFAGFTANETSWTWIPSPLLRPPRPLL